MSKESNQNSWWNPLSWGSSSGKKEIPDTVVSRYNHALEELRLLTPIAKALENREFEGKEFNLLAKINFSLVKGIAEYQTLKRSAKLLNVAIQAKDSFLKIEEVELRYRSSKQNEFYQYVLKLLAQKLPRDEYQAQLDSKFNEVLSDVKSEEGKNALNSYAQALDNLLRQDELGLQMLYQFKKLEMTDFSVLRTISEMVIYLQKKDLANFQEMVKLVQANLSIFEQVAQIIEMPQVRREPDTYARILQYIALSYKYKVPFAQFEKLLLLLKDYERVYQPLVKITQEFPENEYVQPEEFQKEIPGLNIYEKYKPFLAIV